MYEVALKMLKVHFLCFIIIFQIFIEEVMELVELASLQDALVGLPGISGLSTEQRKRLTIAVELVANPSIIFMDEPTSGLDARAAAIVMRTVRNTVDTGRTVVCTIHQPSIDIFEAFDELLLLKRGGQIIYLGPLGSNSHKIIEYFEVFICVNFSLSYLIMFLNLECIFI
jgi:ABC-type multidrug transport system ATPase subunit